MGIMEVKAKLIIAGVIIAILMLPAIFIGVTAYFGVLIVMGLVVGGIIGFTHLYKTLFKDW